MTAIRGIGEAQGRYREGSLHVPTGRPTCPPVHRRRCQSSPGEPPRPRPSTAPAHGSARFRCRWAHPCTPATGGAASWGSTSHTWPLRPRFTVRAFFSNFILFHIVLMINYHFYCERLRAVGPSASPTDSLEFTAPCRALPHVVQTAVLRIQLYNACD